jgi:hypothetical protein
MREYLRDPEHLAAMANLARHPIYDPRHIEWQIDEAIKKMYYPETPLLERSALSAEIVHLSDDLLWSSEVLYAYKRYENLVPKYGERALLIFSPREERYALIGDLSEELKTKIVPRHGLGFGVFWY